MTCAISSVLLLLYISIFLVVQAEEAKVKISEVTGDRVDNKTKLDVIKQEEEAIQAEKAAAKAQMRAEKELKAKKLVEEEAAKAAEEAMVKVRNFAFFLH